MGIEGKDSSVNATLQWSVKSEQIASNWVFYVSFNVTINRCAATAHFPEKDMKSIHWAEFSSMLYEESFMLNYWSNTASSNLMVLVDCINPITKDIFFLRHFQNSKIVLLSEIGSKHMTTDNLVIRCLEA